MKNALEVTSLRKEYEDFTLNDVSFNLPEGFTIGTDRSQWFGKDHHHQTGYESD